MKKKAQRPPAYPVVISYSEEDAGYVARVPALKYCTAFGETYEEAAREIQVAMRLWLESAAANNVPIPPPGPTISELTHVAPLLNVKEVARRAGIPEQTLYAKVRRHSELKPEESSAIANTLTAAGMHLLPVEKAG